MVGVWVCVCVGGYRHNHDQSMRECYFTFLLFSSFFSFLPITTRNLLYDEEKACLPHRERCTRTHNPHYFQ